MRPHLSALPLLAACAPARAPDVVLVTWDTVRADHTGGGTTPGLDALASSGTRFTNARSPVPITLPAHATALSGLYPHHHGARDNASFTVGPGVPLLAPEFAAAGYATAAFVSAAVLERARGLDRGFEVYDDRLTRGIGTRTVTRPAAETVKAAADWLGTVPPTRPAFLWVHLYDPHRPWEADDRCGGSADPYRAEIACTDAETRRILAALEERPGEAVVAVVADHGEGLGEHGELTHSFFAYDSTLRIPMVLRAPGLPPGREVDAAVTLADLAPTLRELAGLPPVEADGVSLVASARGGPLPPRDLPVEAVTAALGFGAAPVFGLIDASGQAWFDLPRPERYALAGDPRQEHDRWGPGDEARASVLFGAIDRRWPPEAATSQADPATADRLRALGYLAAAPAAPTAIDPKDRVDLFNFLTETARSLSPAEAEARARAWEERVGPLPPLAAIRADALDLLDRPEDATQALSASLAGPGSGDTALQAEISMRQRAREDLVAREVAIRDALARAPDSADAWFDLATTLRGLGRLPEARDAYTRALSVTPADHEARMQLVGLLVNMGAPAEALDVATAGLDLPGAPADLPCTAKRLALQLGRPAPASGCVRVPKVP